MATWKVCKVDMYLIEFNGPIYEWDGCYIEANDAHEAIDKRRRSNGFEYGHFIAIPIGWELPLDIQYQQLELF